MLCLNFAGRQSPSFHACGEPIDGAMTSFQLIVFAGAALGISQLVAGVAIGLWLGRRGRSDAASQADQRRATRLAEDLRNVTTRVAKSVRRHHDVVESVDQRLRKETPRGKLPTDGASLTTLVMGVVSEMLSANRQLQDELRSAQQALDEQTSELDEHRQQSLTDPLTGLLNRRALDDHLRTLLEAWRKQQAPFSLLMLDIDRFKQFNDEHGHQAGDAALQVFGQAVKQAVRQQDVVARFGGEEFAILLPHTTADEATAAVRKVRKAIAEQRVETASGWLPLTASGGLSEILGHEAVESLIGRADDALYAAKRAGRDRVFLHEGESVSQLEPPVVATPSEPSAELAVGLREACADLRAGLDDFMSEPTAEASTHSR